jgi:hypothetical protein
MPSDLLHRHRVALSFLVLWAFAVALTVIDTLIWWQDGPRYTHAMWYQDRLDRIRGDDALRLEIAELRAQVERLSSAR